MKPHLKCRCRRPLRGRDVSDSVQAANRLRLNGKESGELKKL
jgi:hypothetical protein